jgi:superoxide dismutase
MLHWFLIPVFVSGVLIGVDFFSWLRGKLDLLEPTGLVGAYGYYFFFIAPLLTVLWQYHTRELPVAPDWRDWIGGMAALNCAGLIIYLGTKNFLGRRTYPPKTVWRIRHNRFVHIMALVLPISALVQLLIFSKFGGIWEFMQAFSTDTKAFDGMGWQFLIAEAFPCLLAVFTLVCKRDALRQTPWTPIALLAFAFFVTKLIFGGLRGSRSNTVWAMFWLCGAIHAWTKPVPRHLVAIGIALLVIFMYAYGFYKAQGVDALETLQSSEEMNTTANRTGRTLDTTLLGDLARSETQAYLLYRLADVRDYDYAAGTTYVSAFMVILPKTFRPDWISSKVEKGTEALYGRGIFSTEYVSASQVYGLAGEAMLNFSPVSIPLAFSALAFVVVKSRALQFAHPDDARRLLLPFLVNMCILVLNSDLDNIIVFFLTTALPVLTILKFSTRAVSGRAETRGARLGVNTAFRMSPN